MKLYVKMILIVLIPFLLVLGCSEEPEDPTVPVIERDIVGNWTSTTTNTADTWQFLPDGTFIDTEGATFQYKIYDIDGFSYIAFNVEELGVELNEEDIEELESSLGASDFIPIYQAQMPSKGSLVIEPATRLYGSDTYFGFTFETYVLRRQ